MILCSPGAAIPVTFPLSKSLIRQLAMIYSKNFRWACPTTWSALNLQTLSTNGWISRSNDNPNIWL